MNSLIIAGSLLLGWNGAAQTANDTTDHQPVINETTCEVQDARTQLDQIVFIENEEEVTLGFDTAEYLPEGFDPHVGAIADIAYVDMRAEDIALGFDTAEYLPEGFDPHVGNLDDLAYIEEEAPVTLDFDTTQYLPEGFDAHLGNWNEVAYVEDTEEEIVLGFDTTAYLPNHFDPHVGDLDKIQYKELDYIFLKNFKVSQEVAEIVQ